MGLERTCIARRGAEEGEVKAHLEGDELRLRGAFRLDLPLSAVRRVEARRGVLELELDDERVMLALGKQAEAWRDKIRSPKGRLDKLGLKPGALVSLVGLRDPDFRDELAARLGTPPAEEARADSDVIFF